MPNMGNYLSCTHCLSHGSSYEANKQCSHCSLHYRHNNKCIIMYMALSGAVVQKIGYKIASTILLSMRETVHSTPSWRFRASTIYVKHILIIIHDFLGFCWKLLHNMIIMESLQNVIILFKINCNTFLLFWISLVDTSFSSGLPGILGLVSIGPVISLSSQCLLQFLGVTLKKYS